MERKGFRILDHPADLGIEAYGASLAEAFEQAATALISLILEVSSIQYRESKTIELSGTDHEHLLVKWLAEVLYLYDGEGFVGGRFEVYELTETHLKATLHGEKFDPKKHPTKLDIKAVTYHQLQIVTDPDRAAVRVFLDV